jgi:hypothetical protein
VVRQAGVQVHVGQLPAGNAVPPPTSSIGLLLPDQLYTGLPKERLRGVVRYARAGVANETMHGVGRACCRDAEALWLQGAFRRGAIGWTLFCWQAAEGAQAAAATAATHCSCQAQQARLRQPLWAQRHDSLAVR